MKNSKVFFLAIAITLVPFPWLLPSIGEAQVVVDCDAGGRIQDAINFAFPSGALIFVTGTCFEQNINVGGHLANITLDGLAPGATARATIFSQTPSGAPLNGAVGVNGARNVRIRNFIITGNGTSDGVSIVDGAAVRLENNIIENQARDGVFLRFSFARIIRNTIQNNGADGINVTESSSARIGHSSFDDLTPMPNTIQGNGGNGIRVSRSSNARIAGNKAISPSIGGGISGNGGHGVFVHQASHAQIATNDISSNGGDGISVSENSGVNLSIGAIFNEPNSTTGLNIGFGIQCSIGGYASGPVGSLDGSGGERKFEGNCINNLSR
jgi:parallel beta-helix repeat protein